jgi:multiple sugar transport system permease protein
MVDAALQAPSLAGHARRRSTLRKAMGRKSTIAFLMTLPLILLVVLLVLYPALYSIHLATLNKSMERFVGFGNFLFLFKRETFWMVWQSCLRHHRRHLQGADRFIVAHRQRPGPAPASGAACCWCRGIPPAMSCLAWLWLFDPSYSAFNFDPRNSASGRSHDRRRLLGALLRHLNVWIGAPFFMISTWRR